jgi:hypothetical protein
MSIVLAAGSVKAEHKRSRMAVFKLRMVEIVSQQRISLPLAWTVASKIGFMREFGSMETDAVPGPAAQGKSTSR